MRRCDWFAADPANCQRTAGEAARSRDAKRNNGIRSKPVQEELEKFFIATDELEDKKLKFLGWRGPKGAAQAIKDGAKSFAKEE
jgi:inorganic pyrophosphatase